MGIWLAKHLRRLGYRPVLHDRNPQKARSAASSLRCGWIRRLDEVGRDVGTAFVAVGSENSSSVILKLAEVLREDAAVIDISSVKTPVFKGLRRLRRRDITIVFSHPLFGPGASTPAGRHVVFTPFRKPLTEEAYLRKFFRGARIIRLGYREHDLLMAYCMAVPRIASLTLLVGWLKMDALNLTTSQRAYLAAASTTLSDSPRVFSELISLNPYTREALQDFLHSFRRYATMDRPGLERHVKSIAGQIPQLDKLYRKMYRLLERA